MITLGDRGGLNLPPLAILTVVLYTIGYFIRLAVMTKVSKSGDPASVRQYFVEEKVFALPLSVAIAGADLGLGHRRRSRARSAGASSRCGPIR